MWIGFTIGKLDIPNLSMDRVVGIGINPLDSIVLLINIILAIYIVTSLNRSGESDRIIRNILIEEFTQYSGSINREFARVQTGRIGYSEAASLFKSLLTKHQELYKWYADAKLPIDDELKSQTFNKLRHVRDIVTSDAQAGGLSPNTVENNIIDISQGVLIQVEIERHILLHNLFKVKLDINKV